MDKNQINCLICFNKVESELCNNLSCRYGHFFHIACLEKFARFKQKRNNEFICPTCNKEGTKAKQNVNTSITVEDTDDSCDEGMDTETLKNNLHDDNCNATNFEEKLLKEIEKIQEDKKIELKKLDHEKKYLTAEINKKEAILKEELESFYKDKETKIRNLIDETKTFQNIQEGMTSALFQSGLNDMREKLISCIDHNIKRKAVFNRSQSVFMGEIFYPHLDEPAKQFCIQLDRIPTKVVFKNPGFYALVHIDEPQRSEIINIEMNKVMMSSETDIGDLSRTYDGRLSFISLWNEIPTIFFLDTCGIVNGSREVSYLNKNAPLPLYFYLKDNICYFSTRILHVYNKQHNTYLFSFILKEDVKIFDSRIIEDDIYIVDSRQKVVYFDTIGQKMIEIPIYFKEGPFSFQKDIISELKNGSFILSSGDFLFFIDPMAKTAVGFKMDIIFPDGLLLNYCMTDEEVIFCVADHDDESRLKLKYFSIKPN
ncbi:unnamed protein product [Dimorphilus gyrociliatus]|uniref:RING-type domain-containing protein n=1 Tax=Dimorphilus gyrociliatus TaxID=2664684 RepID=A0A7I8VGW1_9ANNE|nr:unnamed protein product [Dimorphilus gyrociliatus]